MSNMCGGASRSSRWCQDPLSEEPQLVREEFDLSDIMEEELDAQSGTKDDCLRQLEQQAWH